MIKYIYPFQTLEALCEQIGNNKTGRFFAACCEIHHQVSDAVSANIDFVANAWMSLDVLVDMSQGTAAMYVNNALITTFALISKESLSVSKILSAVRSKVELSKKPFCCGTAGCVDALGTEADACGFTCGFADIDCDLFNHVADCENPIAQEKIIANEIIVFFIYFILLHIFLVKVGILWKKKILLKI